ncbi:hypothetical protein NE237_030763 [Protea cynaroides]|uniref:Uncharacterized protein n=1 Tax=Protea cynaroides TaxID=273540 RepID=A0A9Q0GTM6_9MAGN|nr:hypothetical protein NE237_030763 [Protea cynaroides]
MATEIGNATTTPVANEGAGDGAISMAETEANIATMHRRMVALKLLVWAIVGKQRKNLKSTTERGRRFLKKEDERAVSGCSSHVDVLGSTGPKIMHFATLPGLANSTPGHKLQPLQLFPSSELKIVPLVS